MLGAIKMVKPEDFEVGTTVIQLVPRGMGSEIEIRLCAIESLMWDDGDLYVTAKTSFGKANWQLRGGELYEPVAVLA